jgi:hypothetical protein
MRFALPFRPQGPWRSITSIARMLKLNGLTISRVDGKMTNDRLAEQVRPDGILTQSQASR